MAHRDQVPDGRVDSGGVVGAGEEAVDSGRVAVDEGQREAPHAEVAVPAGVCGGVGVQPRNEDDPGHALAQQELDRLVLCGSAGGLCAEQGGVAVLREQELQSLREGGEDRVVQLGDDNADQARGLVSENGRTLVAEHVQGGQHRVADFLSHAGLAVEHS
ncbi:hypothetical protein SDC9_188642 [bioreactor metagenome]|uniref:Uncharacterized protein n=1 Tax=bioreactor metagenome TaxID=1076179 RepID=A0A645HPW6_9ZZZZ